MFLRRRSGAARSRGQAMVEFALVLPLLALLLVMALDFGRVFFGWVALQNAARIGADRASQTAPAWPNPEGSKQVQWRAEYEAFITNDLRAANCDYPTPHPAPTFTDTDVPANDDAKDSGDLATVHLECSFDLITPLASEILGGSITLTAESSFAINEMIVVGVPDPPPPPPEDCGAPVASFDTLPVANAAGGSRVQGNASPFHVTFTSPPPPEACPITEYLWEIDGNPVGADNPVLGPHPFTDNPGGGHTDYDVTLTVTSDDGTDSASITVRVSA